MRSTNPTSEAALPLLLLLSACGRSDTTDVDAGATDAGKDVTFCAVVDDCYRALGDAALPLVCAYPVLGGCEAKSQCFASCPPAPPQTGCGCDGGPVTYACYADQPLRSSTPCAP